MRPPSGRVVLLSKLEETLVIDGRSYDLSSNQYTGAVHPRGYSHQQDFRIDPYPVATYVVEDVRIEKRVFMVHGKNATVIQYGVTSNESRAVFLEIRPLIAFRDYHALTHENTALDPSVSLHHGTLLSVRPYPGHPRLYLAHNAEKVTPHGDWYRNFEYVRERERGLDFIEDLYSPLALRFDFRSRDSATVIAATEPADVESAAELSRREEERRSSVRSQAAGNDDLVHLLTVAADQYIVSRGEQQTIIAGYPWFTDWGRDTMIGLPGLTLATGRFDAARSILCEFARHVDRGMLPNRFPDAGETPEYNTIDATLWYFEAVRAFLEYTSEYDFVRVNLYGVLKDIIEWHIKGTRYGIRMDTDGLITSSDPAVQLTWMDAKIGDWVVTPRNGKAVEIQALWYNALRTMEALARSLGATGDARMYSSLARVADAGFNTLFWNEEAEYLYDVVAENQRDATLRPNQILAVSLKNSMLDGRRARAVVDAVERDLLTPYGLRSLPASDPRYRGRYEGDAFARDSSYHQGPVWPWLLGPFIDAYLKVNRQGKRSRRRVSEWLRAFSLHLTEAGLGHVSEIFDGDAPHHPRGCFAQAWSVAEILRVAIECRRARTGRPGGQNDPILLTR
jgi:predicted glycogen debranching enzyme